MQTYCKMSGKVAKRRGKKPAQRVVRQNQNQIEDHDDEAKYLLEMELIELVQGYPEIYDIAHSSLAQEDICKECSLGSNSRSSVH